MMTSERQLFLHEEVLLLALRDKEGTPHPWTAYRLGIAGAILGELLLHGRVAIEVVRRGKLVNVIDATPIGDTVLDECLGKVAAAQRRRSPQSWVGAFARLRRLHHRVAEGLCKRGVLRITEDEVLLFFRRKIYPEREPAFERELVRRVRDAIFSYSRAIDARTVVLVSLAHATGLLKVIFDRHRLKERRDRIRQLARGELIGEATKEAVEAVQAAAAVAVAVTASH